MFDDILERENTFVDNKNNKLINSKNQDFSKGVSPWFWPKISNFSIVLFPAKNDGNMCLIIFQKEKTRSYKIKTTS